MGIAGFTLIMDVLVSILLVTTVFYATKLNRHFVLLRRQREELASQLSTFAESTRRAEQVVAMVKATTAENVTLIERQIRRAEVVRNDLERSLDGVPANDRRAAVAQAFATDNLDPSSGRSARGGDLGAGRPAAMGRRAGAAAAADMPSRSDASTADPTASALGGLVDTDGIGANADNDNPRARLRAARLQKLRESNDSSHTESDTASDERPAAPQKSRSELLKALQGMR